MNDLFSNIKYLGNIKHKDQFNVRIRNVTKDKTMQSAFLGILVVYIILALVSFFNKIPFIIIMGIFLGNLLKNVGNNLI